jgi:hypothetical protein
MYMGEYMPYEIIVVDKKGFEFTYSKHRTEGSAKRIAEKLERITTYTPRVIRVEK